MRHLLACLFLIAPFTAAAQERDSVFSSYSAYADFVDKKIMSREFVPLVLSLGGRDEYTPEQLNGVNTQLMAAFPVAFRNKTVFHETDLGGGMRQEARAYWSGEHYAYFYALLHERGNDIVVLNFLLNSSLSAVTEKF